MKDYPKVEVGTRVIAALIDGVMAYVVGFIPIIGAIAGTVYMLLKDGLPEGQSVGKKLMKLQVITEADTKADFTASAKRNAIFALPIALMIIPILGWIMAPFVALVIIIIEFLKIKDEPQGRRLGDTWADTQVIMFAEQADAGTTQIQNSPSEAAENQPPEHEQ